MSKLGEIKTLNVEIIDADIGIDQFFKQTIHIKIKGEELSAGLEIPIKELSKIFDIVGVHHFSHIVGRCIRARTFNNRVINIGHIIRNLWLYETDDIYRYFIR